MLKFIVCLCLIKDVIGVNDHLWHSYKFGNDHGNREELSVKKIKADENFAYGNGVIKWKSAMEFGKAYAIGLKNNGVTVLQSTIDKEKKLHINSSDTELNATLSDLACFLNWNQEDGKKEFITVISAIENGKGVLKWMKFLKNGKLEQFWQWDVNKNVTYLEMYEIENKQILIVADNKTIDLYQFDCTEKKDFWLIQIIDVHGPIKNTALNTFGQHYYLSIPRITENFVEIFLYQKEHFTTYNNITSELVDYVISFKIGFRSFLAINGYSAGIFRFTKNGLIKETIKDYDEDETDFWYPIRVRSHRDEIIVLAQRNLFHSTHKALHIALVTFNGKNFVLHEEVACNFFGDEVSGLDLCMSGEESESGIIGLTEMSIGYVTNVLVPSKDAASSLFTFELEYKILPDPVDIEIKNLKEVKLHLQQMIQDIKDEENEINSNMRNADKNIAKNTEVMSAEVNTLTGAAFRQNEHFLWTNPSEFEVEKIDLVSIKTDVDIIWDELEEIKTKVEELENSIKGGEFFKTLYIEGDVEVHGKSTFDQITVEMFNDQKWNDLVEDIVRIDNLKPVGSKKTFSSLEIQNLNSTIINGVKMQNVVFNHEKDVIIKGDVIFVDSVNIADDVLVKSGKVNDIILEDEVILVDSLCIENVKLEEVRIANSLDVKIINGVAVSNYYNNHTQSKTVDLIESDYAYISGNIIAKIVNGESFDEFIDSLCLQNFKTYIPGKIKIEALHVQNGTANYLNNLKFPDEYVTEQTEGYTKVLGEKIFEKASANELIVRDFINDRVPDKMITLSTPQNLPENFTFENLEIAECLDVDGNITGEFVNKFLPNPTLLDTNLIKANMNFQYLEVEGSVIVYEIFNGTQFDSLLENIIYKDEDYQTINSIKEFPFGFTTKNNLNLHSNSINSIPLEAFITKDTEQTITSKTLNGNVHFQNLYLGGHFGGINITELEDTTMKLNGEQFVSATLIFEDDILAEYIEVVETLNNIPIEDYYFKDGDRVFLDDLQFENVHAENITIEGDVNGNFVDFDLEDFDERRLSFSKNQNISSDFTIKTLSTKDLEADFINDSPFGDAFRSKFYQSKIMEMLQEGQLKIKDLYINGSLRLLAFNGIDFDKLTEKFAWKDRENKFTQTVLIQGDIFVDDLNLDTFNNENFGDFLQNLVYKNETNLLLRGTKTYENGFHVNKYIETEKLNGIPVQNVLRKNTGKIQKILSPITFIGDVIVDESHVVSLNDVMVEKLREMFSFVDGAYIIRGDVNFMNMLEAENINFGGSVNDIPAKKLFENIIHKSKNFKVDGMLVFENMVKIDNNFGISGYVNGLDLSEFYYGAVTTMADAEIDGSVIFAKPVEVQNKIYFENDVTTRYLFKIDLEKWKNNAVFVNQGLIPGNITFEKAIIKDDIKTDYFNNIDMKTIIPIQTNQIISEKLQIENLRIINDVKVEKLVNGIILQKEFENSILDGIDQIIDSSVIFEGNVVVSNNLESYSKINGHDLGKIVTTNTDQNLEATFVFNKPIVCHKNLQVTGFLNGINLTHWMTNKVKLNSAVQDLSGKWFINGSVTFDEDVKGTGFINGVDLSKMAFDVKKKKQFLYSEEKQLIDSYINACEDVNYMLRAAKNQIYFFKHLEILGEIKLNEDIQSAHYFEYVGNFYLWINLKTSCQSHLFIWKPEGFLLLNTYESGLIQQIVTVKNGSLLFFVVRSESNRCQIYGTNIWKFENNNLLLLQNMEDAILLQDSLVPLTFYALHKKRVVEYKIVINYEMTLKRVRQWNINEDKVNFVPRGLHTGLALRNGHKLLKLSRDSYDERNELNFDFETYVIGDVTEEYCDHLPSSHESEILVMNVGDKKRRKTLVAVASHEETSIKRRLDLIKIYEDVLSGVIFHNIPTYKPTSLTSIEFPESGETFLLFLEDHKTLQIYEYRGVEGFKHKMSANVEGTQLFTMNLPRTVGAKFVGLVNGNTIKILEAIMCGNRLQENDLVCEL